MNLLMNSDHIAFCPEYKPMDVDISEISEVHMGDGKKKAGGQRRPNRFNRSKCDKAKMPS